ncbi:MAG: tRNA (adenosine(37)-N6)-dimethylallyltransferase MiaA [Elusimicrobium sp.]|jgi:tRNA dimethylallyltransferase|nr:tRNA (adenosine(37)-N6)-dimethylallyltransferase MiaA [Elusimicrobium sp.]
MAIIIAGPTASGKTDLALDVARIIGGEIISVDSRQVYRGLLFGTAKPAGVYDGGVYTVGGVPYHMVDFLPPEQIYNTGLFVSAAKKIEAEILAKNKIPVFAGGTGMWLQAYFSGMDKLPEADPTLRAKFSAMTKAQLHQKLASVDIASAEAIPAGNIQRVMRALEIFELTGIPASTLRTGRFNANLGDNFFVYLDWEKDELNRRIETRTNLIFDGMVNETRALLLRGFTAETPALKSLGYPQIIDFIDGKITRAAAIEKIVILTRQYAKRQRTWFARYKNKIIFNGAQATAEKILGEYNKWKK